MEKFLFKKVEVWLVLLIVFMGLLAMFAYGWAVFHVESGGKRFGAFTSVIKNTARAPTTLLQITEQTVAPNRDLWAKAQRFEGQGGHQFNYAPGERPDVPYLLLNCYDGTLRRSVAELIDLDSQETVHRWTFDVDKAWKDNPPESNIIDVLANAGTTRFRNFNAFLTPDGLLVTQSSSTPLIKVGVCSDLEWVEGTDMYHHSVELDADGNYWVPVHLEPKAVDLGGPGFFDDAINKVSPEGELLFSKSVAQIMIENGMGFMLYGQGPDHEDPIHLNDIQPIMEDGTHWKRGDVFLSLRNKSMIILYRPETNKVLWYHAGPWLHQHDVNVEGDGIITVFDNAARLIGQNGWKIDTVSGMWEVDLGTNEIVPIFQEGFKALDLRTEVEGRGTVLPTGDKVFVEETIYGRAAIFDKEGQLDWVFINRAEDDGMIYYLNWSRLVDRETGNAVRTLMETDPCDS